MDADPVERRAGRAGHRQGALPGPGGRVRRGRGPLLGPRRARADRRRLRDAPAGDRRAQGARAPTPRSSATTSRARPTTTASTGRPATRRPPNAVFESGRRGGHRGHRLPARAPGADGDVRVRRRLRPGRRQAHALDDLPGAPRPPHRVRAGVGPARAQDPGHRPRHRRRVRQQGADLPRLRVRHRRLAGDRQAGEVDGGPHREPGQHRLRPRLRHARARSPPPRTARSSPSARTCSPTTAPSTAPRRRSSTRPGSSACSPAATTSRRPTAR